MLLPCYLGLVNYDYYWQWIPLTKRINELYENMATRLVDSAIEAGRAKSDALFTNMKLFNTAIH